MQPLIRIAGSLLLVVSFAAAEKVKWNALPKPIQDAIAAETKGRQIKAIEKEVEDGKTLYEVETVANGRTRDLAFDDAGALIESEEEVAIDSIPAAAKSGLEKAAGGKRIRHVEKLTKGSQVRYEAEIGTLFKKSEIAMNADRSPSAPNHGAGPRTAFW